MFVKTARLRLVALLATLTVVALGVAIVVTYRLYRVSVKEQLARLRGIVQAQARLAEAVARFDSQYSQNYPAGPNEATLDQIREALMGFNRFGSTVELAVARKSGDDLVFIARPNGDQKGEAAKPQAEYRQDHPLQRAVSGESGATVSRDCCGRVVLAAFEPVAALGLGMVAKIDLKEIRAPFIRAAVSSAGIAVVLLGFGAVAIFRIARPMARAEEELERQCTLLANIVNNVPHYIFWKDRSLTYLGCNAAFARAAGLEKPEHIVGKTDFDLSRPWEEAEWPRAGDRDVVDRDTPVLDIEETLLRADGSRVSVLTSRVPFKDRRGRLTGVVGVCAEITEHKRALEFAQSTIDALDSQIAILDDSGRILAVNSSWRAHAAAKGFPAANSPVGTSYFDFCHACQNEKSPHVFQGVGEVLGGKRADFQYECPGRCTEAERWFFIRVTSFEDRGEMRAVISHEEISGRKRAEEALRRSEEWYRSLIEQTASVYTVIDMHGGILYESPSVELWFGWKPDELVGGNVFDLVHPDDREGAQKALSEISEHPREVRSTTVRYRHKDGGWRWLDVKAVNHLDNASIRGVLLSSHDVTERKQIEDSLQEKERQLRHKHKMEAIGGLAGGMAHEFNNLLQAIRGYTGLAMEELPPDDQACCDLRQTIRAADRAAQLTRQLLNFSRRDSLHLECVDPNGIVRELVEMVRPLIGEHIEVETLFDESVGLIRADAALLEQALLNLCLNAQDAMPHGGRLAIRTENISVRSPRTATDGAIEPGRYLRLAVSDTGYGMSPEVKERIFEPFFSTKGVGEGTGLGLAMVYGVVRQHEGVINVYSEPGVGTTFKIYLPVTEDGTMSETPGETETLFGGDETILVAEDEPLVRNVAIRILEKAGYSTYAAEDGEEAVRLFRERADQIGVVILDIVMPRLGGRAALEQIRQIRPDVPAVFCIGYDSGAVQTSFVSEEGLPLVEKPFGKHALLRAVRRALDTESAPHKPVPASMVERTLDSSE